MGESLNIPFKGFRKGKKEVTKGGRDGMLVVGIAGHRVNCSLLGPFEKHSIQKDQALDEIQDGGNPSSKR